MAGLFYEPYMGVANFSITRGLEPIAVVDGMVGLFRQKRPCVAPNMLFLVTEPVVTWSAPRQRQCTRMGLEHSSSQHRSFPHLYMCWLVFVQKSLKGF